MYRSVHVNEAGQNRCDCRMSMRDFWNSKLAGPSFLESGTETRKSRERWNRIRAGQVWKLQSWQPAKLGEL
jgi:hypothetical protein